MKTLHLQNTTKAAAAFMLAATMTAGFTACNDELVDETIQTEAAAQQGATENEINTDVPTTDMYGVMVEGNLLAATRGDFNDNSMGSALMKRMPGVSGAITSDTKLVLVKGEEIAGATMSEKVDWAKVYLNGGYIAIDEPTNEDLDALAAAMEEAMPKAKLETLTADGDIVVEGKGALARQTKESDLMTSRIGNIENLNGGNPGDQACELAIFCPTAYYVYNNDENVEKQETVTDQDGNVVSEGEMDANTEQTAYDYGMMADAAALWLNEQTNPTEQTSEALTRAGGATSINELMSCTDEFTYSGALIAHNWKNKEVKRNGTYQTTYRVWGVNDLSSNTDYYYVKQNATLRIGGKCFDHTTGSGYSKTFYWGAYDKDIFAEACNWDWGHDLYYGSWFDRSVQSMELTGKGNIHVEYALPATDNNNISTTIAVGTSKSETNTIGITAGGMFNGSGPGVNAAGSYSHGWTKGSSFTMSTSHTVKEIKTVKNTTGNKVEWNYCIGQTVGLYHRDKTYYHDIVPDAVINDVDLENQVCWTVKNASGTYSLKMSHANTLAAITHKTGTGLNWHWWGWTSSDAKTYNLKQPNRAIQKWHFDVSPSTLGQAGHNGDKQKLVEALKTQFPDEFQTEIVVADLDMNSENTISNIISHIKELMSNGNAAQTLKEYAQDLGCDSYTIKWYTLEGKHSTFTLKVNAK